jgi:hypothetical protein
MDRYCCDGLCNENQGRGDCPEAQESRRAAQGIARLAFWSFVGWLLLAVVSCAAMIWGK